MTCKFCGKMGEDDLRFPGVPIECYQEKHAKANCIHFAKSQEPRFNARNEKVDHPIHYGGADNPYEVIKVLEAWLTREEFIGFLRGNALKYEARAWKKQSTNPVEDLSKAVWYGRYLIEFLKRGPK